MVLSKEEILAQRDTLYEEVDVPEWGGTVRVKLMSASERDSFEQAVTKFRGNEVIFDREDYRAKLVARTLVDATGARMFADAEVKLIGQKSWKAISRIFEVAQRLNGLNVESAEQAEKN